MASRARTLGARAVPLAAAGVLSLAVYNGYKMQAVKLDDTPFELALEASHKDAAKSSSPVGAPSPFTPMAWGSNANLTLSPDAANRGAMKRPTPMTQLGGTPLRDLVLHEKYGAAIDARGDLWMWGAGYDGSGNVGRSLRGKKLAKIIPAPGKLYGLSKDGRLYAISAARENQDGLARPRSYWKKLTTRDPIVDFVEIRAAAKLGWGEYFTSVAAGQHHLLAATSHGRTFSLPLSPEANSHRQLGTRVVINTDPAATIPAESDARFATQLTEIPALSGVNIAQVAASDRSSFARTDEGRVLGFGANDFGQIGLGNTTTVSTIPTPVEIVLAKGYPAGTSVTCTNIAAGSQTTFFTVNHQALGSSSKFPLVDVLSCGNGQYGSLGSAMWSSASYAPARIKTLSGLQEYSEKDKAMIPLAIQSLSVAPSPATHIFAVLDTTRSAEAAGVKEGLFGKDVMVWGGNTEYQLGNGKRSAIAVPTHLPPIIPRAIDNFVAKSPEAEAEGAQQVLTRLQLHKAKADAYDPTGKLIKRGLKCEETVVAGWNCSVLYNKIVE